MDTGGTSPSMGEGTTPWKEEVALRREQQSRTMQDDSMDGIGSIESGTETEQLSRATHGAVAEGIKMYCLSDPLTPALSRKERGFIRKY